MLLRPPQRRPPESTHMNIKLNFINRSNEAGNTQIAIFQKNVASASNDLPMVWTVIASRGINDTQPLMWPLQIPDDHLGFSFQPKVEPTQHQLTAQDKPDVAGLPMTVGTQALEVKVIDRLSRGALSADIYRSGRLLASTQDDEACQSTAHADEPAILLGAVTGMTAGEAASTALLSQVNTELSLLGIASADIVMTGGGSGPSPTPLSFHLENIVLA
ncbi:hypothetical protein SAMN05880566_112159 [Janthinobacterium sp. TND4EL3]|nr:hypothetical protein SAMN05880566_112159 [Janthinobacterium sp. TND4EL3]